MDEAAKKVWVVQYGYDPSMQILVHEPIDHKSEGWETVEYVRADLARELESALEEFNTASWPLWVQRKVEPVLARYREATK